MDTDRLAKLKSLVLRLQQKAEKEQQTLGDPEWNELVSVFNYLKPDDLAILYTAMEADERFHEKILALAKVFMP